MEKILSTFCQELSKKVIICLQAFFVITWQVHFWSNEWMDQSSRDCTGRVRSLCIYYLDIYSTLKQLMGEDSTGQPMTHNEYLFFGIFPSLVQ